MEAGKNRSLHRWMRILHRDIGFFVVGLTVIYGVSGIMLTYRETGLLKSETHIEKTVAPGLDSNQLGRALHLKKMEVIGEDEQAIRFTGGIYDKTTGTASYTSQELPLVLRKLNDLHKVPSHDPRQWFTVLYALCLVFLAISSFWMYKPESRYFKRSFAIAAAGVIVAAVLVLL